MPNWVEQQLHVVGTKADVDRFVREGFSRKTRDQFDVLLLLNRLCPPPRPDRESVDSAVVLNHFGTRTQATFALMTAWDCPRDFLSWLPRRWPSLQVACSVNGEMGTSAAWCSFWTANCWTSCGTTTTATTAERTRVRSVPR